MTVTTSARFNADQLQAALPAGAAFGASGGDLTQAIQKTVTFYGTDDATGQAAITTAAAQFVDRDANKAALLAKLPAALTANLTFINAAKPGTAAAQASAAYDQSVRQARQWNALARIVAGLVDDTSGT